MSAYDYVIVGGGSAGCVLANRLSKNAAHRVLLLEAGPQDVSPYNTIPKGFGKLLVDPKHAAYTAVVPHPGNGYRNDVWARGKMLGGSSGVNGMVYMRGHPDDCNGWEAQGAKGWGWADILRSFKAIEDHSLGADSLRGSGGLLKITQSSDRSPLTHATVAACVALGLPFKEDINRLDHEGVAYLSFTIRDGVRQSAARAFLNPVRSRDNLEVVTDARVCRILFEGTRACAVEALVNGTRQRFESSCEIILSAGALESPKLLQLSGIGDPEHLKSVGIQPVARNPGVGLNMREHLLYMTQWRLKNWTESQNRQYRGWRLAVNAAKYMLGKRGLLGAGSYPVGGFYKTTPDAARPDAQLMMSPITLDFAAGMMEMEKIPGMQLFSYGLRPESRGSVRITSSDIDVPAAVEANYLADPRDQRIAIASMHFMRRVAGQASLSAFIAEETRPGPGVQGDDQILDAFRAGGGSGYHACGTCRMGADADSVVDPRLNVRGTQGLRVMDLSIAPTMISGNTNGPVMAMAWRGADLILEDAA